MTIDPAWLLDDNRQRVQQGIAPIVGYQALCRELTARGPIGELSVTGARSVLGRYSDAWFQAAYRRGKGERVGFPRRKRSLVPVRFYHGTFLIEGRHVRLPVTRGCPALWVRLARHLPYPVEQVRAVTLLCDGGRLWLAVTAAVRVQPHDLDSARVAGVDLGIIHPYAVVTEQAGLLVSGRAIRRLRRVEGRHRRRVHQAHHQAAGQVVACAVTHRVGTLVVGDLTGITAHDTGRVHNMRLRQGRRTHLVQALRDKAEQAGIQVRMVDERGSSSTCPACRQRVPKPSGRRFHCPRCRFCWHRDLVGAANIAATLSDGSTNAQLPARIEHRRAAIVPARRDRRRHLHDRRRRQSCLATGHPQGHQGSSGCRSPYATPRPCVRRGSSNQGHRADVA